MTWRAVLLLAAYLLLLPPLSPLFVLGPLAGLLVASRPATRREWTWIGAAVLWVGTSVWQPAGLAAQTTYAWAFFVTGAFVALMLSGQRRLVPGALLASLVGLVMASGWVWALGSRWREIELAVSHGLWDFCRTLIVEAAGLPPERQAGLRVYVSALSEVFGAVADLFPAVLVLTALPGLALAWNWYHRICARPAGRPGGRFAEFRFSDHLIWAVVGCVALFVLPAPDQLRELAANVALVIGGLYAARGAAIAWGAVERFPLLVVVLLIVGILALLPVALGGFFALGLADTWVDFRRRFPPAGLTRE